MVHVKQIFGCGCTNFAERVVVSPDRDNFVGSVEVDKTYIGGKEIVKGKQGRGTETKTLVVVASEFKGKQIGRIRFGCLSDASGDNLMRFIEDNIEPKYDYHRWLEWLQFFISMKET